MEFSEAVLGPLPFLVISEKFKIPTYSFVICLSALIVLIWGRLRAEKSKFERDIFFEVYITSLLFGFIGARLFHVLYEAPDYYRENPVQILYVWQGGFVYYGGLFLGLLTGVFYVKKIVPQRFPDVHPINFSVLSWCDFFCPLISLGYALGRVACFLNGCCYGTLCTLPWAVSFKTVNLSTGEVLFLPRHPTQIYAFAWEIVTLFFILFLSSRESWKKNINKPGSLFFIWLFMHALGRMIMESFRADPRGELFLDASISTTISIVILVSSGILLASLPKVPSYFR